MSRRGDDGFLTVFTDSRRSSPTFSSQIFVRRFCSSYHLVAHDRFSSNECQISRSTDSEVEWVRFYSTKKVIENLQGVIGTHGDLD